MGDIHFVLRHALTGAVFLLFFGVGAWAMDPGFLHVLQATGADDVSSIFTIVVSSALIGITIHGAHIGYLYFHRDRFSDRARQLVETAVRGVFAKSPDSVEAQDQQKFAETEADAFFVWQYHRLAPEVLIEWARRRRSYYYLGVSWAIACATGWASGAVWKGAPALPHSLLVTLALVLSVMWSVAAVFLARRMRRDADDMEFLWAAARVKPELRRSLGDLLSPKIDTN